jgi:polysaccharide biosynthesis protein PelF
VHAVLSGMRICLLTGGGYPYRRDALAGWCRTLVEGLGRFSFDLVTVTDREPPAGPAYPLPRNVASARAVALPRTERRRGDGGADAGTAAAALLCRGMLGGGHEPGGHEPADRMFADGLARLAELAGPGAEAPLAGVPLADVLLDAWRAGRAADERQPRLSLRDARTAATLLRHASRALAVRPPEADLVHCVGGTTPLLAALAGRWRTGTPLLLTEARAPVARQRPSEERLSATVKTVLRRFRRAVARTGYAEAGLIAPLSAYHHTWALRHGARPSRLVAVPAGVDPAAFPNASEATAEPAVVWAGSGGPDSGLGHLLEAFRSVVAAAPGTVLHLVGVAEAHVDHCAEQVERTGLGRAVRLHPLPADPRDRYAAGHVVVHVPGPADPPYRLIEAMMSGRAVVGLDVGPVAETLGDAGVLVPPGEPAALAAACVGLLRSPARRRALGDAARRRALAHFTADRVVRAYGALYTDLTGPPAAPAFELALSVAAPRHPRALRWLTGADADHDRGRRLTGADADGGRRADRRPREER